MKLFFIGFALGILYNRIPALKFVGKVFLMAFGVAMCSLYGLILSFTNASNLAYKSATFMQKYVAPMLDLTFEIEGRQFLVAEKPCVFVSNHQSSLDAIVMYRSQQ